MNRDVYGNNSPCSTMLIGVADFLTDFGMDADLNVVTKPLCDGDYDNGGRTPVSASTTPTTTTPAPTTASRSPAACATLTRLNTLFALLGLTTSAPT